MLEKYLIAPSLNSLFITALLILFSVVSLIKNRKEISNLSSDKLLKIVLLFSVAIGIHGLLHLGTEYLYGFNPYKYI